MKQKPTGRPSSSDQIIRDIKRKTRKQYGAEEKIRIVLDGLRGEDSIAELCRREGIAQSLYYKWSKDFMEAGKKRLAGDIVRQANTSEVTDLRREARDLKEVVAELNRWTSYCKMPSNEVRTRNSKNYHCAIGSWWTSIPAKISEAARICWTFRQAKGSMLSGQSSPECDGRS